MHRNDILLQDYRLYARFIRKVLYLGGILQSTTRSRISSYITSLFVLFTCLAQSIAILNFCRDYSNNLIVVSKCLCLASCFIGPALMAGCFLVKHDMMLELHDILNDLFEEQLAQDQETKAIALSSLYQFSRPAYTLVFTMATTVLLYICLPIFDILLQIVHHIEPRKYSLLYPTKYPWIVPNGGFLYYLHFLYESFTGWCVPFAIGGGDGLFGFYSFQISSILRAISYRFINSGSKHTYPQLLKTFVKKHQQLLRCRNILQDIYGLIIIRMVLTNAISMCALIFEIFSFTDITFGKICTIFSYTMLKLLQTFTYSWYGSCITSASEDFRQAIYFSKWLDVTFNSKLRTDITIMMMQKPMNIVALKMCTVSVQVFINVINTTLSYVLLLQTLDETK